MINFKRAENTLDKNLTTIIAKKKKQLKKIRIETYIFS